MKFYEVVLQYVNALKWPVFASVMVYSFRASLKALGKRIIESDKGSIKGPGFDISYEGIIKEVEQAVTQEADEVKEGAGTLSSVATLSAAGEVVRPPQAAQSPKEEEEATTSGSSEREWLPASPERSKWLLWQQRKKTAEAAPTAAVKLAWDALDGEVSDYKARMLKRAADAGEDIEGGDVVFTENLQDAISKLQVLRNNVVVLRVPPTPDEARAFVNAAEEIATLLEYDYRDTPEDTNEGAH
jgi:hypothetical protein